MTPALCLVALAACAEDPGTAIQEIPESPVITSVSAEVSPAEVVAGAPAEISCLATYSDGRSEAAPDAEVQVTPELGLTVDARTVTASIAGTYAITCQLDGVDDVTAAALEVTAAEAVSIVASVQPAQTLAGVPVTGDCETEDRFGNRAPAPDATVHTSPSRDVTVTGRSIVAERAGEYAVECRQGRLTQVSAPLSVQPATAARIVAEASPRSPRAGERVQVTCFAVDAFANPVETTAEVRVDPAPTTLDATGFEATVAGTYAVTCVIPGVQTQSDALPVVVQPNLPATLEIVSVDPDLPIYPSGAAIEPTLRAFDAYGNLIEDPRVQFSGLPADAVTDAGRTAILLGDGPVILVAAVEPPTHMDQPVQATRELTVDGLPPEVTITFPARGEMVERDPSQALTIQGQVTDLVSAVSDLVVNGAPVVPDASGAFSVPMNPEWGTNLIEVSAVDAAGNVRQLAQSFHIASAYRRVGPNRTRSGRTPDGLIAHLGQDALDDDAGDVDDLATIARLALQNANVASLIPSPVTTYRSNCWITSGRLRLYVDAVRFGTPNIDIQSRNGGLYANITIPNVVVDMHTSGDVCDIPINVSGSATATRITASGTLAISSSGAVSMPTASTNISGLRINLSLPSIIDWAIDGIINLFRNSIADRVEDAFRDAIRQQLPDAVEGFLDTFELSTGFDLPAPLSTSLSISSGVGSVAFNPAGGRIGLDAAVWAWPTRSPEPRGGILQQSRNLPSFGTSHSLAVGLSYDMLNQALYSAWYGGALDLDLQDFIEGALDNNGQNVTLEAVANPLLPPIVRPSSDPNYPIEIQIGDLGLDIELTGIPNLPDVQSTIYGYAVARANLTVDANGAIQVALEPNPTVVLDVQSSLDAIVDPTVLRDALETIIDAYLPTVVGDVLGGIPLPTFDVSSMAGGYLPPNIELGLGNAQTRFHSTYVILEGDLVQIP